jgi:hypothetical protein
MILANRGIKVSLQQTELGDLMAKITKLPYFLDVMPFREKRKQANRS